MDSIDKVLFLQYQYHFIIFVHLWFINEQKQFCIYGKSDYFY